MADPPSARRAGLSLEQVSALPPRAAHAFAAAGKLLRLADVSDAFGSDPAFARQLRRKFV
jgi:hypothetical protein